MADAADTPEHPPLLPIGRHPHTVAELASLCVDGFPQSNTRKDIMRGLGEVIDKLSSSGIIGELWVDGSFLTKKDDPEDVDVVLCLDSNFSDSCTIEQKAVIDWVASDLHDSHRCHSFVITRWPASHANYWFGEYFYAYWMRQWGFSRTEAMKGIAVIQFAGSDAA